MKRFLVAAFAVAFAVAPAVAADKVLKSFDEQMLKNVLAAVGATGMETGTAGEDKYTLFIVDNVKYVTALRACKSGACEGLMLQCSFSGETYATTTPNSFNLKHVFATAAVSDDRQTLLLGRFIVAAGGVTEAHVTETFKLFFTLPPALADQAVKDRKTPVASATPQATPAAASTQAVTPAAAVATGVAAITAGAAPASAGDWIASASAANNASVR